MDILTTFPTWMKLYSLVLRSQCLIPLLVWMLDSITGMDAWFHYWYGCLIPLLVWMLDSITGMDAKFVDIYYISVFCLVFFFFIRKHIAFLLVSIYVTCAMSIKIGILWSSPLLKPLYKIYSIDMDLFYEFGCNFSWNFALRKKNFSHIFDQQHFNIMDKIEKKFITERRI